MMNFRSFKRFSAERTIFPNTPAFHQHKKVYSFCKPYVKGKNVLDLGCGNAIGTEILGEVAKSIVALDKDPQVINQNSMKTKSSNIKFEVVDFEKKEINNMYDAVIALQVIEHFKNPDLVITKLKRVLRKGGLLILSTPNSITQSYNENPYHYKEFSPKELKRFLEEHFSRVKIYGLYGNLEVMKYEQSRKRQVLKLFKGDKFKLRKLLPRQLLMFLFDLSALLNKKSMEDRFASIDEASYKILPKTDKCIDLIAFVRV